MERISNKSIAMLLIATIAVYLGGTFISLSRLSEFGATGFATDYPDTPGNVSVTITSTTSITWTASRISWGSGYVASACTNCTMFTNGTNTTPSNSWGTNFATCCTGLTRWNDSLLLKNTGNNNVSLQMNVSNNASDWFGTYEPQFLGFKIVDEFNRSHDGADNDDTANSCSNATWGGYRNVPGSMDAWAGWTNLGGWTNFSQYICGSATVGAGFSSRSTENEASFDFIVTIPQSYPGAATQKSTMITMLATS